MSTGKIVALEREDGDPADLPTRLERMTGALTAPEIAKLLGMGRTVVYEMAAGARIPHYRLGTMIRFDPVQVAGWLREREIGSPRGAASVRTTGTGAANEPRDQRPLKRRTAA